MSSNTGTPHIYPKTNISRVYYRHLVDQIEHDPLIRHSTLTVAGLVAAIAILAGSIVWYAHANPGNLMQTTGTVTTVVTGKTQPHNKAKTYVIFEFDSATPAPVSNETHLSVRQPGLEGEHYQPGDKIKIGYHPKNPYLARLINDSKPPVLAIAFWFVPLVIFVWLLFVALFRHHARQVEIWNAAEAANIDE